MNEQTLKTIKAYDALPWTPEKAQIDSDYLNNEIGSLDFFSQAARYLNETQGNDRL